MDLRKGEHVRALTESLVQASLDGSQVSVELIVGTREEVGEGISDEDDEETGDEVEVEIIAYPAFDMHLHSGPFGGLEGDRKATDWLIKHLQSLGVKDCALCGIGQRIENSPIVYYGDCGVKDNIVPSLCNDFRNAWFKSTMSDEKAKERVHVCLTGFTMFKNAHMPGGIRYAYNAMCAEFGEPMISGFGEFNVIKQAITDKDSDNMKGLHQCDGKSKEMLHMFYENFKELLDIQYEHTAVTKKLAPLLMHCDMGYRESPQAYLPKIKDLLKKIDDTMKNGKNVLVWLHFGGICPEMAEGEDKLPEETAKNNMKRHVDELRLLAVKYPWLHFGMAWERIYGPCLLGATQNEEFMTDFIEEFSCRLHIGSDYVSDGGKNLQEDYNRAISAPMRAFNLPENITSGKNTKQIFGRIK